MKGFVDSDVMLDVGLSRAEHLPASRDLLAWFEAHPGSGYTGAHVLANVHYVLRRTLGDGPARRFISGMVTILTVAPTSEAAFVAALGLPMADFEDALVVATAQNAKVPLIVTRNQVDYRNSPLPALAPESFLEKVRCR